MTKIEKINELLEKIENYIYENNVYVEAGTIFYDDFFDHDEKYIKFLKEYAEKNYSEDFFMYQEDDDETEKHIRRMSEISSSREPNFLTDDIQTDYIYFLENYLSILECE